MSARAALDLLAEGGLKMGPQWQAAHEICQSAEGDREHDLVHALCHWIEGDLANRDWWYSRVRPWTRAATLQAEWQALSTALPKAG